MSLNIIKYILTGAAFLGLLTACSGGTTVAPAPLPTTTVPAPPVEQIDYTEDTLFLAAFAQHQAEQERIAAAEAEAIAEAEAQAEAERSEAKPSDDGFVSDGLESACSDPSSSVYGTDECGGGADPGNDGFSPCGDDPACDPYQGG